MVPLHSSLGDRAKLYLNQSINKIIEEMYLLLATKVCGLFHIHVFMCVYVCARVCVCVYVCVRVCVCLWGEFIPIIQYRPTLWKWLA